MKKLAFLIAFLSVASLAFCSPESDARKAIDAQMQKVLGALRKGDSKTYFSVLTDDFQSTDKDGKKRSKTEMKAEFERQKKNLRITNAKFAISKFKLDGNKALVTSTRTIDMDVSNAQGKTLKFQNEGISESVWVRQNGQWLMSRSTSKSLKMTVNGKPYKPPTGNNRRPA